MEFALMLVGTAFTSYFMFDFAKQGITWIRKKKMKKTMDATMDYAGCPVAFSPECEPRDFLVNVAP